MKNVLLATMCLFAIVLETASASDESCVFTTEPDSTVDLDGAARVKIVHKTHGNLTVRALGRKKGKELVARYSIGTSDRSKLDGFQFFTERNRRTMRVEVRNPELANVSVPEDPCPPRVSLWLNIPPQVLTVVIKAGNADIDVRNINTYLRVSHGSGDLKVRDVESVVVVESGPGKVDIEDVFLDVDIEKKRRGKIILKDILGDISIDERHEGDQSIETNSITINGVTFGGRKMQAY